MGGQDLEHGILRGGAPLVPPSVARLLPDALLEEADKVVLAAGDCLLEEIHLRAGGLVWLTAGGRNLPLSAPLSRDDLDRILLAACGGSLYAHAETLKEGYLTMSDGVRVGVAGHAVVEDGQIVGVRDVTAMCFRLPGGAWIDPAPLVSLLRGAALTQGMLLYAPPGGGKTTALRSLVRQLASGERPLRVAVVDSRGELAPFLGGRGLAVDILSGYPRGRGIEIAVRSLGAQMVICDELCGEEDARVVLSLAGGGVPLVATAHADSLRGLFARTDLSLLHRAGIFGWYVRICRQEKALFEATPRAEVPREWVDL